MQLYKITTLEGACVNGGRGTWPLPTETEPGEWWEVEGPIVPCSNGLHLASLGQLSRWVTWTKPDAVIFRAETEGPVILADGKYVARKVRLLPGYIHADDYMRTQPGSFEYASDAELGVTRPPYKVYELAKLRLPKGHTLEARVERAKKKIASYERKRLQAIRAKREEVAADAMKAFFGE